MQSQFGRAIDGAADVLVSVVTVFPAFFHLYVKDHNQTHLMMMVPAIGLTAVHLWLYDFYKESYLRQTRLDRGGEGEDVDTAAQKVESARSRGPVTYFCFKHVLLPYLETQRKIIRLLNPYSMRDGVEVNRSERTVEVYRKHNQGPMRLWAIVSLAPHSYLMAICAMFDRLDVYLYIRLFAMNAVFIVALMWQRRATERTNEELMSMGAVRGPLVHTGEREILATDP